MYQGNHIRNDFIQLPILNFHLLYGQLTPLINKALMLQPVSKDYIEQLKEAIIFLRNEGKQIMQKFIEFEDQKLNDYPSSLRDEIKFDNLNDRILQNYYEAEKLYEKKDHKSTKEGLLNAQLFHKCTYEIKNCAYLIEQANTLKQIDKILQQNSQVVIQVIDIEIEQMTFIEKILFYIEILVKYLNFSIDMKINYLHDSYQPLKTHVNLTTIVTREQLSIIFKKDKDVSIYYPPIARKQIINMLGNDKINHEEVVIDIEEIIKVLGQLLDVRVITNLDDILRITDEIFQSFKIYEVEYDYYLIKQKLQI